MEKVTLYRCEYCKKYYKSNRHFCFKDPANKACGSCRHYRTEEYRSLNQYEGWHKISTCIATGKERVLTDTYEGTECEVEFPKYHGKRGYMCDLWQFHEYSHKNK